MLSACPSLNSLNVIFFNQMLLSTLLSKKILTNGNVVRIRHTSSRQLVCQQKVAGLTHSFTDSPVRWPPTSVLPGTILLQFPHTTAHTQRLLSLLLSPLHLLEDASFQWTGLTKKNQMETEEGMVKEPLCLCMCAAESYFLSSISYTSGKDSKTKFGHRYTEPELN